MINSPDSYKSAWACLRPVLPLYLGWRSLRGKEDSTKRGQRLAKNWQQQRPEGVLICCMLCLSAKPWWLRIAWLRPVLTSIPLLIF